MENTLKRKKEKDRRRYILTDDVINKQRGQHVFYFYHNIFIEKKEPVTDQIQFFWMTKYNFNWSNWINYWYFYFNTEQMINLLIKQLFNWPYAIVTEHSIKYWYFEFFTDNSYLILIKFYWSFIIKYWPFNL